MANQLKMAEIQQIWTLQALGWSQRRIARQLGLNRETVARYLHADPPLQAGSKPAISTPAKSGRTSECEPFIPTIEAKLDAGLSAQRIYQDLIAEVGFSHSYQSVKRMVRRLTRVQPQRFERIESAAGEEAQVDFGCGAWIGVAGEKRRRPHVFRIVLSHSRKGYSEAVLRQGTEEFLRCLENAFRYFGGVPKTLVIDNLRAAVTKADWYEPELHPKLQEFCRHYGTVVLPTRPAMPRHKGKIERGIDYVQENALRGRCFESLAAQNQHLLDWERNVADPRIHGTTRQQVRARFEQQERPALLPLPASLFPCFQEGRRRVHRDSFIEVQQSYYEVPPEYIGRDVWARWDNKLLRVFNDHFEQVTVHARVQPGQFSRDPNLPAHSRSVQRTQQYWLTEIDCIGTACGQWTRAMLDARGPTGLRAMLGVLSLARQHSAQRIEAACARALIHGAFRLKDIRRLLDQPEPQQSFTFLEKHPLIRDLAEYQALISSRTNPQPMEKIAS